MNHRLTTLISGLTIVLLSAFAGAATLDDEIRERLNPAGSVCVFGEECAAGMAVAGASGPGMPRQFIILFAWLVMRLVSVKRLS